MRKLGLLLTVSIVILMSVAWVEGQQGDKKKGGFGGGGGQQSPLNVLNRADVKKELAITDEQLEKLPAEVLVAISKVLSEKQFKRFKQLELQQRGNNAFKDAAVQKALNITDEQKKSVNTILDGSAKEIADLGFGGFGKGGGNQDKIAGIRKDAKEKINGILTKQQRSDWSDMVGEPFTFTQPTFPGFGGIGKDKKGPEPKKDAKKKDFE